VGGSPHAGRETRTLGGKIRRWAAIGTLGDRPHAWVAILAALLRVRSLRSTGYLAAVCDVWSLGLAAI